MSKIQVKFPVMCRYQRDYENQVVDEANLAKTRQGTFKTIR